MANKSPYKDKDGLRLAGVTTVTGQELGWNKGVLINWANKKGLEGIEVGKMVDDLALVGTLGHQLVMDINCQLVGDDSFCHAVAGN